MNEKLDALLKQRPLVLDGAWGTQMQARGLPVGACGEGWNLDEPAKVQEVAQAYVDAGPGKVLSGLLKKFDAAAPCAVLSDLDSVNRAAEEFHPYLCGIRNDYTDLV